MHVSEKARDASLAVTWPSLRLVVELQPIFEQAGAFVDEQMGSPEIFPSDTLTGVPKVYKDIFAGTCGKSPSCAEAFLVRRARLFNLT